MHLHPSAKTTPLLRQQLIDRVLTEGDSVQEAARAFGLSRTTVYKGLRRWSEAGPSGLLDRSSAPKSIPHRTSEPMTQRIRELRGRRWLMRRIARAVRVACSTVGAVLRRLGLGRLPPLTPPPPVVRYEHAAPGDLLHIDVKKLARFSQIGHRIHGDRTRASRGAGWQFLHVCVDDHSRVAYAELLADERKETAAGFLERAIAWFAERGVTVQRVLTDNGSPYKARTWRETCDRLGVVPKRTKPYTPRTNGKAERFIQTALREWAYAKPYASSGRRQQALPYWLRRYNEKRGHHSLGGLTPNQRLPQV